MGVYDLPTQLTDSDVTLSKLLELTALNNPEIAAAGSMVGAAEGRLWQADLYPNPTLELEAEDIPTNHIGLARAENVVSLSQPVILSSRRSAAVAAARADTAASKLHAVHVTRHVLGEVRLAYVEAMYLNAALALYDELATIAITTLELASARFSERAAPESESLRAQVEVHELALGRRRLERKQTACQQRLVGLLGGVALNIKAVPDAFHAQLPEIDLGKLRAAIASDHPGLLAARKAIEASEQRRHQAQAQSIPDIDVRLAYGRNTNEDHDFVEAGLSIPLPLFNRNQGRISESEHQLARTRWDEKVLANRLQTRLSSAYAAYLTAHDDRRGLDEHIIKAAQQSMAQSREGYRAGHVPLTTLLEAQRTLARARLAHLDALRDQHLAYARLWQLAGAAVEPQPLSRN